MIYIQIFVTHFLAAPEKWSVLTMMFLMGEWLTTYHLALMLRRKRRHFLKWGFRIFGPAGLFLIFPAVLGELHGIPLGRLFLPLTLVVWSGVIVSKRKSKAQKQLIPKLSGGENHGF